VSVSPVDGTVVRWRLKAGSTTGTVKLRVLRPAGTSFIAVTSSVVQTVTSAMNTFSTSLPIKAGDVVALDNSTSGLYFTNSPSVALPLVKYFQPAIADGATGAPNNQQVNLELLMNADVTPTVPGVPPTPPPGPAEASRVSVPRSARRSATRSRLRRRSRSARSAPRKAAPGAASAGRRASAPEEGAALAT
jgi:hypothetical protein